MITRLTIRNFALIEHQEIDFSNKLTIITGETGAGKSIILGALGLIMGNRAEHISMYDESLKCVIEGFFNVSNYDLKDFFDAHELDYDKEVVVRREITPQGKSRSFINDTPVTLKVLQDLSNSLIDLHQQFDTLDIHNVSFQLRMIDALADNRDLLQHYQTQFKAFQADKRTLAKLIEQSSNAAREMDFLNYQLSEFNKAELMEGEQDALEKEQMQLTNAEVIKRTLGGAYRFISEDENALISQLQDISKNISTVRKYHANIPTLHERLENTIAELQDLSAELENVAEETEYDGARIEEIQTRLDTIYKLLKKHNVVSIVELLDIQEGLQQKLNGFGDLSEQIVALERKIVQQKESLDILAEQLSHKRRGVKTHFETSVHDLLHQLAMEHAHIRVDIRQLTELNMTGCDEVEFMFAPNKGSKFASIKDTASGGELSRLTLCTKSLVASAIPLPTLIFDEIDTGISGDVALKMGNILRDLSLHHQVISITHSAQIASKADKHYFVYKRALEDRTITSVKSLSMDERVRAIATMLSTSPPSASAIENAKELIAAAIS